MDELIIIIDRFLSKIIKLLHRFYNKLRFLFNKYFTIQKMYEPLTSGRNKANEELSLKLSELKKESSTLIKNSEMLAKENKVLKEKIISMQELLLRK